LETQRTELTSRLLPIIDLSAARSDDPVAKRALAQKLDAAFSSSGFCYIAHHGIAQSVIDDAFAVMENFFHAPLDEKLKLAPTAETMFRGYLAETRKYRTFHDFDPDRPLAETNAQSVGGKENFIFGPSGANSWPEDFPEFRAKCCVFVEALQKVGDEILRMLALALGIDENFFRGKYGEEQDTSVGVLAYYPSLTPEQLAAGRQSLPEHADFSCLSLVVQDDVGGLQVQDRATKAWVDAKPLPGTIVANIGDLLARWSNDRYVSSVHRVQNTAGRERFSFIAGHNPRGDIIVDPRDLGIDNDKCAYPPVEAGRYMWARMMETGATDEDIAAAKETEQAAAAG
jgi:isopenicillin N synthase-like dioxygenase